MSTEYVILVQDVENGRWEDLGRTIASSSRTAIRVVLNGKTGAAPPEGKFVAIPARSWQPVAVKVETVKRVRVG